MIVQTQTYCKKGIAEFQTALAKLKSQQTGAGCRWTVCFRR